jgi:hypothetical protein
MGWEKRLNNSIHDFVLAFEQTREDYDEKGKPKTKKGKYAKWYRKLGSGIKSYYGF